MSLLQGKTILIADDEPELREVIAMAFERQGCRILEAGSGGEALAILRGDSVDAIVSDIRMPGLDGFDLLQGVRAMGEECPCFVFITGFTEISEERARDLGAFKMLAKPFHLEELIQAVRAGVRELASESRLDYSRGECQEPSKTS